MFCTFQVCNFIKKETLAQVFSCEFCEISKNTFLHKTPIVAASECMLGQDQIIYFYGNLKCSKCFSISLYTLIVMLSSTLNTSFLLILQSYSNNFLFHQYLDDNQIRIKHPLLIFLRRSDLTWRSPGALRKGGSQNLVKLLDGLGIKILLFFNAFTFLFTVVENSWNCEKQKQPPEVFRTSTGKHLYQRLFFNKAAGLIFLSIWNISIGCIHWKCVIINTCFVLK